jgi:hypothetical protein
MVEQQVGGIVLVLVAAGLVAGGFLGPFSTYQEVQSHETTEATVVSSGMESATEQDDGETEVEYEYAVDGTSYTDNRIFHSSQVENEAGELRGKEFDGQGAAQDVLDRYQEGDTVTVYYDTDDPEVSYLEDPSNDLLMTTGMMGLFALVFGGVGVGAALGLVSLND